MSYSYLMSAGSEAGSARVIVNLHSGEDYKFDGENNISG